MLTLLRMTTAVVAALIAAIAFDWTDPAPRKLVMLVGGPLAALILALLWLTRTRPSQATRLDPNPWREVWVGLLAAGGWTGLLLLFFVLAARIPELTEPILDANRDQVESVLQLLVRGGNWRAAADEAMPACVTAQAENSATAPRKAEPGASPPTCVSARPTVSATSA